MNLKTQTRTKVVTHSLTASSGVTYSVPVRVRMRAPLKTYTGGVAVQTFVKSGSTPAVDNVEVVKLQISDPALVLYLNSGVSGSPEGCIFADYMLNLSVKGNATLTLTIDTIDNEVPGDLVIGQDSRINPSGDVFDDFSGVFCQIIHTGTYIDVTTTRITGGGVRGFTFAGFSEDINILGAEK